MDIPSSSALCENDFFLIEYPGIVGNLDNALNTLGGNDTLKEVKCFLKLNINLYFKAFSGNKSLELRYRPENLYQNGVIADKKTSDGVESGLVQLVFKIRRKKSDPAQVKTECLGMVKLNKLF